MKQLLVRREVALPIGIRAAVAGRVLPPNDAPRGVLSFFTTGVTLPRPA